MHRSAIAALLLLVPAQALAAGFELRESSAHAQGTAYAGAAASDSDAGFLFYNPASLMGVESIDGAVNATGLLLGSSGSFTGTTIAGTPSGGERNPSNFISDAFVPAFDGRYRIDGPWAIGMSITSPWGESTKYGGSWTGRYFAMTTRLVSLDITPVISYQPLPNFAFALGPQIQYLSAELTEAIDFGSIGSLLGFHGVAPGADDGSVAVHGNSWSAGYVLGTMWKPMPTLSLGLSYRSEIRQTLTGNEDFVFDQGGVAAALNSLSGIFSNSSGRAKLPTPAEVTGGVRWEADPRWTVLAGLEFTNWNSLKQLLIASDNPANPPSLTVLDWNDTWFGSVGVEYRWDRQLTLRLGTAYDVAAAPSAHVEPRIPDANRYWISGGFAYRLSRDIDFDFAVSHLFTPQSTIDQLVTQPGNSLRGSLFGKSNSDATIISLQLVLRYPFAI